MADYITVWQGDPTLPYVLHCEESPKSMLDGMVIAKPFVVQKVGDPDGKKLLRFYQNRGHQFEGEILAHTETNLTFLHVADSASYRLIIAPMTENEFLAYQTRYQQSDMNYPQTREQLAQMMEDSFLRFC